MDDTLSEQQLSYSALESLLSTLTSARRGDFSARMDGNREGIEGEVVEAVNDLLEVFFESTEGVIRLGQRVNDGQLSSRAKCERAQGRLAEQMRAINEIVAAFSDHTQQVQLAVGQLTLGDLTVTVDVSPESVHRAGDLRQTAESINKLAAHLKRLSNELTRTASAIGQEGRLSVQAQLEDAKGSWHVLVSAVNNMTKSLFDQVSDLGDTARALAAGTLSARANVTARGDLQPIRSGLNELATTVNGFCIGLRRVGSELAQQGRLDLTLRQPPPGGDLLHAHEATNAILGLLTATLREANHAVEELVAGNLAHTAVARDGDVGALARNLARLNERERRTHHGLSSMLKGRFTDVSADGDARDRDLFLLSTRLKFEWLRAMEGSVLIALERADGPGEFCQHALIAIAQSLSATVGAYYVATQRGTLERVAALGCDTAEPNEVKPGEGLVGRVAQDRKPLLLSQLSDGQIKLRAGLFEVVPRALLIYPVCAGADVVGVLELAFVQGDGETASEVLEHVGEALARATRRAFTPPPTAATPSPSAERLNAMEEELVIANARLETLGSELRQRDQRIRALEADRAA